jgi:phosphate transport system permease protein
MNDSSRYRWRKAKNTIMRALSLFCVLISVVPLFLIFYYTLAQGIGAINFNFFIQMPKPVGETGGGMANALVGTGILIGLGCIIGLPISIMAGIYLSENRKSKFAFLVRFFTDVLSGVPSIVVGVVAYMLVVIPMKQFSAIAGGVALGILMIPTATRTTEEMLKLVPDVFREGALALGIPRWRATVSVILPIALKGITTGVLLAVARAAGETAPLLFTALGNRFWSTDIGHPIASLTVFIFDYANAPFDDWNRQAWGAAFVLIMIIFIVNITFRYFARSRYA